MKNAKSHANNISEQRYLIESDCNQFLNGTGVGGYIEGLDVACEPWDKLCSTGV